MVSNQLSATTNSSSTGQATTQSLQSSTEGNSTASSSASSGVQPGTSLNLLKSSGGITLSPTALSTVNLPGASATQTSTGAAIPLKTVSKHHVNGVFLSFAVVLVLAAVAMFIATSRSVKTTT